MFKRIISVIILGLISLGIGQFVKETALSDPQRIYNKVMPKLQYLSGQEAKDLVYSGQRKMQFLMNYANVFPVAQAQIHLEEVSLNQLKLCAKAQTIGLAKAVYKAFAESNSLIDRTDFFPLNYTEKISYGEKEESKEITYDQKEHIAIRESKRYKIPPLTFCPLSAFYYLQLQDLKPGSIHRIKLFSKEEIYILEAKVEEAEDDIVKLSGQVKRENLSSSHGVEFEFWMAQSLKTPLLFKVKTQAGLIIVRAI